MFKDGTWIVIAEMLLALGLAAFVVWWTMFHGRKPRDSSAAEKRDSQTD